MSRFRYAVFTFLTICVLAFPAQAKYSNGDGSAESPYQIATAADMNEIGENPNDWDKHFKLMADIDLGSYTGTTFHILGTGYSNPFTGVFDGNGHTISNFTYSSTGTDHIGLFGYVYGINAEIKNLGLIDPNIDAGIGWWIGSLAGVLSVGSISGCYVEDGSISGDDIVGGLVGYNNGNLSNCYATANASGGDDVGGLIGYSNHTIFNCYATGDVSGNRYVGGLVGANVGGTITNCYSTGGISGSSEVGGLVGENHLAAVISCYSTGSVTGDDDVGGLVGYNYSGTVTDSFWDVNSSGMDTSAAGTGKTTAEMQTRSTFTDASWDFVDVWDICEGTNYPKLAWQILLPGDFLCPDGVETNDLAVLVEQWLLEELSADVWPDGGDGVVDFLDWAIFANGWQISNDIFDLADFADQWLKTGANYYIADIAPQEGDGFVNFLDFAIFADHWLQGM